MGTTGDISIHFGKRIKWTGLLTPKPFEVGQYLVSDSHAVCFISEIHERHVIVILENGLEAERRKTYLRQDIKDGLTRQMNTQEFKMFRALHE